VNVYTNPVSETTSSKICVPVNVASSNAYSHQNRTRERSSASQPVIQPRTEGRGGRRGETNLLHDTCLALGEGDVPSRFVGDVLDLDLSTAGRVLFHK
jgi:hypothetical protein